MPAREMTTEKSPEERVERALELASKIDISNLVRVFSSLLRAYGQFAQTIGTLQRDQKDSFEALQHLGEMAPEFLEKMVDKAPPEVIGVFMKLFLRITSLSTKLNKLMDLSPEEKIEVGESLLKFADEFEKVDELLKRVRRRREE